MPKCQICDKLYHPDWCVVVDEDTQAVKCAFCYTGKDELTLENELTGETIEKVTKDEASKNYKMYLREISEKRNVKEIIMGGINT